MRVRIFTILICMLMLATYLTAIPSVMAQTEEHGSVYDYEVVSVKQTGADEITVKVQARYCPACNPNDVSNPGCIPFTCGYPPPYYPYHAGCSAGYPDGRFIAVRIKDSTGIILGTQKLICNPTNWPLNVIIARDFVFTGVTSVTGSIIAEADIYCSWCGHWYPSLKSLEVAPLRVCIDPGHGGSKPGTLGWDDMIPDGEGCDWKYDAQPTFPNEEDINLDIALKVKAVLEAKNIAVYMTRTTDTDVGLQERCDIANNNDCDVFVSIHCNAQGCGIHDPEHPVPDANGTETLYYPASIDGLDLAKHVQSELVESIGLSDRGTRAVALYVLANTDMPAALVEVAYLTNPKDFEFLTQEVYVPSTVNVLKGNGEVVPMDLEGYLRGVVAAEMYSDWDMEALKAQAVAARTYASTANNHAGVGAHVCTTTHCQAWMDDYNDAADQAVSSTPGQVIMRYGNIIDYPVYFSHCIGQTRNSEDYCPPTGCWYYHPYLRSVSCSGALCNIPSEDSAHDGCRADHDSEGYFGHGVGMCQHGAQAMAEQGKTYVDILGHYYTGVELGSSSTEKAAQGIANGILWYFEEKGLTFANYSPIDIVVTDPDGLRISKQVNEIPGATYSEIDLDGDGDLDDQIRIPDRKIGEYVITVIPEAGALPTDTYTLEVSLFGIPVIVAKNVQIADIPIEPYVIKSTTTGIVLPVIEAVVRIESETLNLKGKGVFTAFITLPEGYDITDIDVSTVVCEGASAIRAVVSEAGNSTFIVKFNRQDLVDVTPGDEVTLKVTGQLNDGTRFQGSDTTRVIEVPIKGLSFIRILPY